MKKSSNEQKQEIRLTDRDFEIFRLIEAQGSKTSMELFKHFWKDGSKLAHAGQRRIRKLILSGFLERENPALLHLSEAARAILSGAVKKNQKVQGTNQGADENELSIS